MKQLSLGILICLVSCISTACTYTGSLRPDFYQPLNSDHTRLPLKVAVVLTNRNGLQHVVIAGNTNIDIGLSPALMNAVKAELSTIFNEVTLIDDPLGPSKQDLLVFVSVAEGHAVVQQTIFVQTEMRLDFKDPALSTIAGYHQSAKFTFTNPSGGYRAAQMLTILSVCALCPVTIPYMTHAFGSHFKDLLEGSYRGILGAIADDIRTSKVLYAYQVSSPQPPTQGEESTVPDKTPQPPSKYDALMNCVVAIRSSTGEGSGFFVTSSGLIVTSNRVVGTDKQVYVQLRSGAVSLGTVVVTNELKDLALVSVQSKDSQWLPLGDLNDAPVGSDVIAIGASSGLTWNITKGIVSAIRADNGVHVVQTDAVINMKDSGGPLISLKNGSVIGVNQFGLRTNLTQGIYSQGQYFAISSDEVLKSFDTYLKTNSNK